MTNQELKKDLIHKTEELRQIKEVLAIFLDKVYFDVDNIHPEDLEYKLRNNEINKYQQILEDFPLLIDESLQARSWIFEISQLCKNLGATESEGHTERYNMKLFIKVFDIKLFIKALARENYQLKKMGDGKQKDGESRTNNLGSSGTATY